MILAEDFWLRGKAAQSSLMQLWAYNTAFAGTATIQAWKMGLSAPTGFWQAMGRVGASNAPGADVVPLPKPNPKKPRRRRQPATTPRADGEVAKPPTPVAAPKPSEKARAPGGAVPAPEPEVLGPSPHLLDAPRGGKADDLTVLKGVGAKLAIAQRVRHLPFRPARDARRRGHRLAERAAGRVQDALRPLRRGGTGARARLA
jgi:predicted flap endonuclease-1-like 5' DNA nuclease